MEIRCCEAESLSLSTTLRVLSDTLQIFGAPPTVWFKESSQRNLRKRDFLVPRGALKKVFPGGKAPEDLIHKLKSLNVPGIPPIQSCMQNEAGLIIQLDRPAVFQRILTDFSSYLRPAPLHTESGQSTVILNCASLHTCHSLDTFKLSHLRAALVADHVAEVLRLRGVQVHLIPAVHCKEVSQFLHQLGVFWPSVCEAPDVVGAVSSFKQHLKECEHECNRDADPHPLHNELPPHTLFNLHLKTFAKRNNLCQEGYDPNMDTFLVREEDLKHVAVLQKCVQDSLEELACCTVLHVVNCEDEFHQQKLDLLWKILDPAAGVIKQKHLICGPVKVLNPSSPISCSHYFQLRQSQMQEASVMKYGERVKGKCECAPWDSWEENYSTGKSCRAVQKIQCVAECGSANNEMWLSYELGNGWEEIINCLTSAAIKFEMLSTAHRAQVTLDLVDTNITTKGTKSGAFVMYNCARLATMFESYNSSVHQGLYPEFPPAGELNCTTLREEGEWLLLFNYIMPFPEVLAQSAQISLTSPGIRVTANTDAVCKFLINFSMDFSSYYNRVHILGEPLPHLFGQMFARLQLMKAVRGVLHSALDTLHIRPLTQI